MKTVNKLIIISGASSGLGLELAKLCLAYPKTLVWTLSRGRPAGLSKTCKYFKCDLSDERQLQRLIKNLQDQLTALNPTEIVLVNNAAMISPIGYLGKFNTQEIQEHLQLNLISPIQLSNFVLSQKTKLQTIINISSGAAHHPIANWSLYCASKAGLSMLDRCYQVESKNINKRIISFSPGLIDTPMQTKIRTTNTSNMKDVLRFKNYKKEGQLRSPLAVAMALSKLIFETSQHKKAEYDVQELLD